MTKSINIINAETLSKSSGQLEDCSVFIENEKIAGFGYLPDENDDEIDVLDCKDCIVIPDIVDSFVHLPDLYCGGGQALKELSQAALKAGIPHFIGFPNTSVDTPEEMAYLANRIAEFSDCRCQVLANATKKRVGKELAEMCLMVEAGADGFCDGGSPDAILVMKHALQYSQISGKPVVVRPKESELAGDASMTEGITSTQMGLKGEPALAESMRVARDLQLLEAYGGKLHFFPITTQASIDLIEAAKRKGLDVTCGTAPHYLLYTDEAIESYDTYYKVDPPLRHINDRNALIAALRGGKIDTLASDHVCLSADKKRCEFVSASPGRDGMLGLIPDLITLKKDHDIDWETLIACVTHRVHDRFATTISGLKLGSIPTLSILNKSDGRLQHMIVNGKKIR